MAWVTISSCFLVLAVLVSPSSSAVCPERCVCSTTSDGLHRATCSDLSELYKFTLRQRHHNINILHLSHNNITKLSHELDRLTEIVTLDLSTNGITDINKFLNNAKKLVHLNLANNRIRKLSAIHLPTSVSSLDLTNNLLQNVPSDLGHLISLEHLELEGNPLDCSCDNIRARDRLLLANVIIDKVKCATPAKSEGRSWLELKTKDVCKTAKIDNNLMDMMMGDQPLDVERIGEESTALKSMSMVASNILDEGNVIQSKNVVEDDDVLQFMKVSRSASTESNPIEGSGEFESTTIVDLLEPTENQQLHSSLLQSEEILSAENIHTTDDPIEGSGEGSGFSIDFDEKEINEITTTPAVDDLEPGPVRKFFNDDNGSSTEYPLIGDPSIFQGGSDWHSRTDAPVTEKVATPIVTHDTTVSQKLETPLIKASAGSDDDKHTTHKTGTYVCIAIIVVLLVGLIGFAIIKGQMRKRRDRRLLRQQKRDVEKASKEMVDMNKSLLGKPAIVETPIEKKSNGKYELVPTHETNQKKGENGDIGNGIKHANGNGPRTDSPRDTNQNKSSSKDNNLVDDTIYPTQDTSFESAPSPDSRKDSHSLSSEDLFVPINDEDTARLNGTADSDISQPLLNGDHNTDSDFMSPSREYVPVYPQDMGRVRIKMTETPKPKTPVLVNRSRSNAGDIIITPSMDSSPRKSTT